MSRGRKARKRLADAFYLKNGEGISITTAINLLEPLANVTKSSGELIGYMHKIKAKSHTNVAHVPIGKVREFTGSSVIDGRVKKKVAPPTQAKSSVEGPKRVSPKSKLYGKGYKSHG